jgi:hypothetical protein
MPTIASESVRDELDEEFDLDIRIDDIDPAEPDRIHRALTVGTSCTMCCAGGKECSIEPSGASLCHCSQGCTEYSACLCTDVAC